MAGKMAVSVMAACLLLVCIGVAEAAMEEPKMMHLGGKVLCQDCSGEWNDWVNGTRTIKGARVSVTCMCDRGRVFYYGSDETDGQGVFNLIVNKYTRGNEVKAEQCLVRLVSSPDPVCNLLTNFAGGRSGVKLSTPSSVYRNLVKYDIGALYCTTPMCDEPDTN